MLSRSRRLFPPLVTLELGASARGPRRLGVTDPGKSNCARNPGTSDLI